MLLIVAGNANKEIASRLDLSTRTIETHRGRIMEKTDARSLADLIELALASGSYELK
jgi:FixJ family two-component response regulator